MLSRGCRGHMEVIVGVLVNWGLLLCGVFWVTLAGVIIFSAYDVDALLASVMACTIAWISFAELLRRRTFLPVSLNTVPFSTARLTLECACGKNDWNGSVYTALERREGEMKPIVRRIEAKCNTCGEKIQIELGARK